MIQIHYGYGKGKTSSLNGAALRALGAGKRVVIFRFLKGRLTSEDIIIEKLGIPLVKPQASKKFVFQMNPEEREIEKANNLKVLSDIDISKYDVFIFDEIIDLCADNVGFLTEDELFSFCEQFDSEKQEVILSGHLVLRKLFEKADLITEYKAEKHYYDVGVKARLGFEY